MHEDPIEMIRYFSDFLTEISLIIANIKDYVYEVIDVNLTPARGRSVSQSMSSIILATHKTFDDLKKIESILTGVVKSKRIISQEYSSTYKKRSKTTYSRIEIYQQRNAKIMNAAALSQQPNEVRTIKRKMTNKNEIKQVIEGSASSEEEATHRNKIECSSKTEANTSIKQLTDAAVQHPLPDATTSKKSKERSEQRIKDIVKHNGASLSKIMETNNQCLRLVRSAKKQLKVKKK